MAQIKIDKGIPIPERRTHTKFPFADMEIGDSFFVPAKQTKMSTLAARVSVARKRHAPRSFLLAKVTEKKIEGTRVWRIEDREPDGAETK